MTTGATSPAEKSSNFYLGFLFLDRRKREALSAVYAYCRLIDDIVDSRSLAADEARRQLAYWREEVARLFEGRPTREVSKALLPHVAAYRLPQEPFLEMIRGCEMDLDAVRYETPEDLESYMRGVASSVGKLSIEIFGYAHTPPERMREFATLFGYAFQLTNIIRDVGADLELGRVYLPAADMKAVGFSAEALSRREHSDSFVRLMDLQHHRAKAYYRRARGLVDPGDRRALLPAEVMAHLYEGLLDDIKAGGYRVLFHKSRLSGWRKLRLAGRAWLYCRGF